MSYTNGTQFYNLPQTVGSDKRDWFDTNSAFAAVDAALHSAVTGQATDAEAISTINGKLADDEADIAALQTKGNTHDSQIAALQTTVNTQASQIQDVRQDAEDMITANNEGAAATSTRAYAIGDYFIYNDVLYKATAAIAIGDTIVPNTNCEATNVDTEITQLNSDLGAKSSASAVTGDDAFSKIATLNTALSQTCKIETHFANISYNADGTFQYEAEWVSGALATFIYGGSAANLTHPYTVRYIGSGSIYGARLNTNEAGSESLRIIVLK